MICLDVSAHANEISNCAIFGRNIEIDVPGTIAATNHATDVADVLDTFNYFCLACEAGYKPTRIPGSDHIITDCAAIADCSSTYLNSCSSCTNDTVYEFLNVTDGVDFSSCVSIIDG